MGSERLIIPIAPVETKFTPEVYDSFVKTLFGMINELQNPDDFLSPYEFPIENIQKIAESDNIEYKESIRSMADDVWQQNEWLSALMIYYILMHIITFLPADFYKLGYALAKLDKKELAQKIIDIYEKVSTNKKVTAHAMANYYYTAVDLPYKAIDYYIAYTEEDPTNPLIWLSMGHCYSTIDDEVSKEKQLEAYKKAYELKPEDPTIVKSLLTFYEKAHDEEQVKILYPKLIELSPTPRHSLNYGLYLMSWGQLNEGGKYFSERFDLENYPIGYPKSLLGQPTKWNYTEDLSDKVLLIHYEEGFGDSIMYGRFLPLIKQYAQQTAIVVQPQLVNLFKSSPILSDGVEIYGDIKEFVAKHKESNYRHMPLMDMPYPLGVDTHFIPFTNAYLNAPNPVSFDTDKLKIGIAYSGDVSANYNGRDILVSEFYDIARLDGVQLYSLQVGETTKQLQELPPDVEIIDLGKDFKDFVDTANAIMGLDLVISSDNVILNLAGALGKRTYGVFNKYPNYRWFELTKSNVGWYESVSPFQCDEENDWTSAMNKVKDTLTKEFLN